MIVAIQKEVIVSEVVAKYMGQMGPNDYGVNVRTAHPTGKIGDAGFVRRFNSEHEAKEYAKSVNKTGKDTFVKDDKSRQTPIQRHEGDVFVKAK